MENQERNYYMVRAKGSSQEDFHVFFKNSVVAIGWSGIDFTKYDEEALIRKVKEVYYSKGQCDLRTQGRRMNAIRRFRAIKAGDLILIPFYSSVRFAVAKGDLLYSEKDIGTDLANQQKVDYLYSGGEMLTVPRNELSGALQQRLRVPGSIVSDLYEFGSEIEEVINQGHYTYDAALQEKIDGKINGFKEELLQNIRKGKTHLEAGGVGLETLVKELFECEGYQAKVCSKSETEGLGDVDVEAVKSDKFTSIKVIVQVKHHDDVTGDTGLQQLEYVQKSDKYDSAVYLLLTSADVDEKTKERAENSNILVMNGWDLVEWIYENIEKLSLKTLRTLGITKMPQII